MGQDNKVYIIAEVGVNHNGSIEMAKQLIDVAVVAGVDAVKFQTFKAEKLVSLNAPKAEYQIKNTESQESQFEMIKKLELDENAHQILINYCANKGVQFLSTPFDLDSMDLLLDTFELPLVKIPSGDITNGPLLLRAAQKGKPIVLSTGMSTLSDIEEALSVLAFGFTRPTEKPSSSAFKRAYFSPEGQQALEQKVTLLHCTTEYPSPNEEVNLRVLETMKKAFGLKVGYSDHTAGITIPIAAVALGATVIEKHFTLDKGLPGPDHKASLEPEELIEMVKSIRTVEVALGSGKKIPSVSETKNMAIARKSLVANQEITKGEVFSQLNLSVKRPGTGISPMHYWDWLGRSSTKDYRKDEEVES